MKKILFALFFVTIFCNNAVAKYNPPEDVSNTRSNVIANRYFNKLSESDDGKMTFEEYQKRPITREDRRNMRQDQKDGKYLSDQERFKAMDTDGDGLVSREEMADYIRNVREEGRNFY